MHCMTWGAHPEYAEVLREEIARVSAEEPSGKFRKKSMPKLKKLDSFIKESQRVNPLGACESFLHKWLEPSADFLP